jgi:hypothetical protein
MEHTQNVRFPCSVRGNDERGNSALLHEDQSVGGQRLRGNGEGLGIHDFGSGFVKCRGTVALEETA